MEVARVSATLTATQGSEGFPEEVKAWQKERWQYRFEEGRFPSTVNITIDQWKQ